MKNLEKLAELAKALPAQYTEAATSLVERMGEVIEGIGDKPIEWRPQMLKLVQGTSDRSKLPKGANIGAFVLGEDVVAQPFPVIPLRLWTTRQYWNPDPEQAKMICNSPDAVVGFQYGECKSCPYSKFDEETKRSQCNKAMTYLVISADLSNVFLANFAKTNYTNGLDWQKLIKTAGVSPFKRIYTLSSQTSTKSKNVEMIKAEPVATNNRVAEELLPFVQELFNISGKDREASIKAFYEYVENRKTAGPALAAPEQVVLLQATEESTPAVTDAEDIQEVTVATTQPSSGGKKYKL